MSSLQCDAFCGEGSQTRSVSCQKDGSSEVVSDSYCEGLKPVDTRSCSVATCQWVVSEWTEVGCHWNHWELPITLSSCCSSVMHSVVRAARHVQYLARGQVVKMEPLQ